MNEFIDNMRIDIYGIFDQKHLHDHSHKRLSIPKLEKITESYP